MSVKNVYVQNMKVNKPIPKLTRDNLSQILKEYPSKYDIGYTNIEIVKLLSINKLKLEQFYPLLFGQTYTKIENNDVYYKGDVYKSLIKLIK